MRNGLNKQIKKALIIDDEEPLREIISEVLSLVDIGSIKAENGNEAIKIAEEQKDEIDLILIDFYMPEMSGEETYEKLKDVLPKCPVIFMSGYDFSEQVVSEPNKAVKLFIKKPFTIAQLQETVTSLIN
jgi:DNA-binding NtrC family response regulator